MLVACFGWLSGHLSGKELSVRFAASAFRELLLVYVFRYFPFSFEGRMWDLIVSVPVYPFTLKRIGAKEAQCCHGNIHSSIFL